MPSIEFLPYLSELLTVTTIAIFMSISPGADFVMITRNSLFFGRSAGLYSSLGISVAIWIHVAYSIAGLSLIISNSIIFFSIIKYLGAAYLIYIGWKTFRSNSIDKEKKNEDRSRLQKKELSNFSAFKIGFITNALNPKTTIFFLSIFTQIVDIHTPLHIQLIYGAIISLAHLIWFSFVAFFLSHPILLKKFNRNKNLIEKVVGSFLIIFGLKVAMSINE